MACESHGGLADEHSISGCAVQLLVEPWNVAVTCLPRANCVEYKTGFCAV